MNHSEGWTLFNEAMLHVTQTVQLELSQTHDVLFAASFVDEFEAQLVKVAVLHLDD